MRLPDRFKHMTSINRCAYALSAYFPETQLRWTIDALMVKWPIQSNRGALNAQIPLRYANRFNDTLEQTITGEIQRAKAEVVKYVDYIDNLSKTLNALTAKPKTIVKETKDESCCGGIYLCDDCYDRSAGLNDWGVER